MYELERLIAAESGDNAARYVSTLASNGLNPAHHPACFCARLAHALHAFAVRV